MGALRPNNSNTNEYITGKLKPDFMSFQTFSQVVQLLR